MVNGSSFVSCPRKSSEVRILSPAPLTVEVNMDSNMYDLEAREIRSEILTRAFAIGVMLDTILSPAMTGQALIDYALGYNWDELKDLEQEIDKRAIRESDEHIRLLIIYLVRERMNKALVVDVADGEQRYLTN